MAGLTLPTLLLLLAGALPRALMAQEFKHSRPGTGSQGSSEAPTPSGNSGTSFAEVQQSPRHTVVPAGGSVNITCSTGRPLKGLFLRQTWPRNAEVVYYEDAVNATVDQQFWGRISFTGSQDNLTITMSLLQLADSGIYTCCPVMYPEFSGPGTMVTVTEKLCQERHKHQEPGLMSLVLPWGLAGGCFFLGLGLGMSCALRTQIRDSCGSRGKNPALLVYEDICPTAAATPAHPIEC
ncbi:T-cell antigen CD7 [Erethizon dorsatum]